MKTIKFFNLYFITFVIFAINSAAQGYDIDKLERLNAQKIAFFTQKLQLTSDEAERFWPVYNEYQKKKNEIQLNRKKSSEYFRLNYGTMTDNEIEKVSDEYVSFNKAESDILLEYHQKFKEILPIKKVMRLYQAEVQYKGILLRQIRNSQQRQNIRRF